MLSVRRPPPGDGLRLSVKKKWVGQLLHSLGFSLAVLQVVGTLAGLPIPHLSALVEGLKDVLPLEEMQTVLAAMHESEALQSQVDDEGVASLVQWRRHRPCVSLAHIRVVKLLLATLGADKDPQRVGLQRAYRTQESGGDGACTWVCAAPPAAADTAAADTAAADTTADTQRQRQSECYKRFQKEGKDCLLLNVELN